MMELPLAPSTFMKQSQLVVPVTMMSPLAAVKM